MSVTDGSSVEGKGYEAAVGIKHVNFILCFSRPLSIA